MIHFLNLIRWKNLLLIALTQILIKYALFPSFNAEVTLDGFGFSLLLIATLCIAAAGNIINDIYDIDTDLINKPNKVIVGKTISESRAFNLFFGLTIIGVCIGFYLSNRIGKTGFSAIFIFTSALLYVYTTTLKQIFLVGNIAVSILVALSIVIVGLFDLLPAITSENQQTQLMLFKILLNYAIFAFMINVLREILKDMEDMEGDTKSGMRTLPIVIGKIGATKILFGLSFIPLIAIVYYLVVSLYHEPIAVAYFLVFIIAPLLYFIIKIVDANTKKEFHFLSNILKLILFFGLLSFLLYKFNILN